MLETICKKNEVITTRVERNEQKIKQRENGRRAKGEIDTATLHLQNGAPHTAIKLKVPPRI